MCFNIFPLAFFSPQSIEALLRDDKPRTLDSLMGKLPMRWELQKTFLQEE
jgi:hypothetical protein